MILFFNCGLFTSLSSSDANFPNKTLESFSAGISFSAGSPAPGHWYPFTQLNSALRSHAAAEQGLSVGSREGGNWLFSSSLPSLQVCWAFYPFHRFIEKTAKKIKHLDSTSSQKITENRDL